VDTSSALSAFERMQEKVETLESQAEVSRQCFPRRSSPLVFAFIRSTIHHAIRESCEE